MFACTRRAIGFEHMSRLVSVNCANFMHATAARPERQRTFHDKLVFRLFSFAIVVINNVGVPLFNLRLILKYPMYVIA